MVSIGDSSADVPLALNAEAKVAEEANGEQGANRLATGWNAAEVADMAKVVSGLVEGWRDSTFAVKLLRALCALSATQPGRLLPAPETDGWGFVALEIAEELDRLGIGSAQLLGREPNQFNEHAQRRMKEHWPKLEALWEREAPTIGQLLRAREKPMRPTPFRHIGGGTGNPTRFGFQLARAAESEDQPTPRTKWHDIPLISYRQADITGHRLIRWLSDRGFYLGGRAGKLYLGVTFGLFMGGVFLLWILFVAMTHVPTALDFLQICVSGVVVMTLGYLLFAWQFRLIADRVTLAPMLLQPFAARHDDYLLELRPDEETARNTLYMVRYVADCPICGNKRHDTVHIASGRREFYGRLVGRCSRSPNEHVFSFDHVTRQGRFLR